MPKDRIVAALRRAFRAADTRLGPRADVLRQRPLLRRAIRALSGVRPDATLHEEIFTPRYGLRDLKDGEHGSFSGPGSTVARTEAIRDALPRLLRELGCRTLIDAPCGDFKWMQHVELPVETYIGVDVIKELIEINQRTFGDARRSFLHLDLVVHALPKADVVLNRDMLIHLSFEDIGKFLALLKTSGCTYLLTTHFPVQKQNVDIRTGQFRPVNLEIAPFHFPAPKLTISEQYTANPAHADKSLALWAIADLPSRVSPLR